jgi:hypothetical protein
MPHRNQTIFDEGWIAWTDGALYSENPYPSSDDAHEAWLDGWRAAEEDFEHRELDDYGDRVDYEYDKWRD